MPSVLLGARQSLCVRRAWRERLSQKAKCLAGNSIRSSFCPYPSGSPLYFLSKNTNAITELFATSQRDSRQASRTHDAGKRRVSSFCTVLYFVETLSLPPYSTPLFSVLPLSPPLHPCPDSPESHCVCLGWSWTPDPLAGASRALGLEVPALTARSSGSLSVHGALFPVNAFSSIQILPQTLNSTAFTDLGIK